MLKGGGPGAAICSPAPLLTERIVRMARAILVASFLLALIVPAFAQPKDKAAPQAANNDPVVARLNGQVIHLSDLQIVLHAAPPEVQQAPFEQVYPQLLNTVASEMLLAQAARKAKVDTNPAVQLQINGLIADAYIAQMARGQITEAKLREAYDRYAKNAPQEEEISARHILVPTEQEAKDIIEQLKKGADFATLAKEKTTDPSSKASGGDLGYFKREQMLPEFANVAFALKKGEYTQAPVHTKFGWHVIKVEDRRPGKPGTYEQVAPQIARQMAQQIADQRLQELRKEGKIELFDMNGKPIASAAPAPAPAPAQKQSAPAPTLSLPGGPTSGAAPGVPTLSPATAPDQLRH